jgi:hypothetical protein
MLYKKYKINHSADFKLLNLKLFFWHLLGNAACKIIDQHGHNTHHRLRRHLHRLLLAIF